MTEEKMKCECGAEFKSSHYNQHVKRSKQHATYLDSQKITLPVNRSVESLTDDQIVNLVKDAIESQVPLDVQRKRRRATRRRNRVAQSGLIYGL